MAQTKALTPRQSKARRQKVKSCKTDRDRLQSTFGNKQLNFQKNSKLWCHFFKSCFTLEPISRLNNKTVFEQVSTCLWSLSSLEAEQQTHLAAQQPPTVPPQYFDNWLEKPQRGHKVCEAWSEDIGIDKQQLVSQLKLKVRNDPRVEMHFTLGPISWFQRF